MITDETRFSDEYYNLFGFSDNESATREECLARIHPDDIDAVYKAINDSLENTDKYSIEYRINMPDGQQRYVHGMGKVERDRNNKPVRFYGTVHNVTERRQAETELEEYQRNLEELVIERTEKLLDAQDELVRKERLSTLGQLTATVSHELRNPLAAMLPSTYLLRKSIGTDDARALNAMDVIDKNIMRCDQIIDELLDFTRATDMNFEKVDLAEWLSQIIG